MTSEGAPSALRWEHSTPSISQRRCSGERKTPASSSSPLTTPRSRRPPASTAFPWPGL